MFLLIKRPLKSLLARQRSRRFLKFFGLALVLAIAFTIPKNLQSNSATRNDNYRYLAEVFDRSFATTQTDKNARISSSNLGFMVSYAPTSKTPEFDSIAKKVAFTYDNAVAALAFIAVGDRSRAKQLVDTIIEAQKRDRFYQDGRIRNAYKGGTLDPESNYFLLPGSYDNTDWQESEFDVSTHTGNVAWAMLALLGYYQSYGGEEYLAAAISMGEWVEQYCRDERGAGGYLGGFKGWEPQPERLNYKSTEHNLDLYAAFARLYLLTENSLWQERAEHAKGFIFALWDSNEGKFWTGTEDDGIKIYREVIPVDAQAWTPLALKKAAQPYGQCLKYAERHHQVKSGFDFNQDGDGIWYEGTAQMALAYRETGQTQKYRSVLAMLAAGREPSGGMPTTNRETLTTGFVQPDGNPWLYFHSLHVGATAWAILAERGVNPFWLGSS